MKKKKLNITSLFYLDESILNKDFFLVPLFLAKQLNADFNFVYPKNKNNEHYPLLHRGANLIPIKSESEFNFSLWKERQSIYYILKNAHKIDILFLVWLGPRSILLSCLYKLLNRRGYCIVKGDMDAKELKPLNSNNLISGIKIIIKNTLMKSIDLLLCETSESLKVIREGRLGSVLSSRVYQLANCFDEENRVDLGVAVKDSIDKENIMLIVGRIGADTKNHTMLLQALDRIRMNDWRVIIIGNIADKFKKEIANFYDNNPDLKDRVSFIGPIYSKEELWEYFSRSKVFLMTSIKEGFPNVYPEALRFGCYIISTKVSGAFDITDDGNVGKLIEIGDVETLKEFLQGEVFQNKIDFRSSYLDAIELSKKKFLWSPNIRELVEERFTQRFNF
ncbi:MULTISPECIES: glycosyltransferase [Sphingobacterium]|uniref:glycosyltransferase n=1 Tax=Sphingobacterium TaxID=28453 RepID=UPI00258003CE|nr:MULTISPECIES: glycosyltransferase [Sphingobacterium]